MRLRVYGVITDLNRAKRESKIFAISPAESRLSDHSFKENNAIRLSVLIHTLNIILFSAADNLQQQLYQNFNMSICFYL